MTSARKVVALITPAEVEVAAMLAKGMSPKEIALALKIDRTSVHYNLLHLKTFFGARHLYHLAVHCSQIDMSALREEATKWRTQKSQAAADREARRRRERLGRDEDDIL